MKSKAALAASFFTNVGKVDGLQVWHIEKFKLVEVPPAQHGAFYENDSYVVLRTIKIGSQFQYHVHFWIGETSTADEYGTAAYASVEIDDHFGGMAIQHREVMGHEGDTFKSYFPHGLQILKGGIASGFRHVDKEAEFKVRFMQIKGKKHIQVVEVPCARDSLNSGDVFVLDTFSTIFIWSGKASGVFERQKGGQFATSLKDQRHFKQTIVNIEDGSDDNPDFWKPLGGKGPVKSASEGGSDTDADAGKSSMGLKKIVRVSDASGQLKFDPIAEGKLSPNSLKTEDVFIVDSGYEIFVWVGKKSTVNEMKSGLQCAQTYLNQSGRPAYLPITKVVEGAHVPTFDAVFHTL